MRFFASAAAVLLSTAAMAADAPAHDPAPPGAASAFDWGGFYLGAVGGWGWGDTDWTYETPARPTADHDTDGFMLGGEIGFDWQRDWLVLGALADMSRAPIEGDRPCPDPAFTCESEIDWLASVRGKAGVASGRYMAFATAGLGAGDIEFATTDGVIPTSDSKVLVGWTAGAGVAAAFTQNLVGKTEYLYYDLGSDDFAVNGNATAKGKIKVHTLRVALGWLF